MPRVCSISRLPLIALLLAAFGSVAWAKPKVAILGLEVTNSGVVDPKDAGNAAKLTEELRRNPGAKFELAPNSNRELQDEKLMGNCDTEKPTCMAPIGSGIGAEYLIYGRIEKATEKGKDGYKTLIKLLNVKEKRVEEISEGFVSAGQISNGSLKDWSQQVRAKLAGEKAPLAPVEKGPGKLVVKIGNTPTGKVSIDGQTKGQLQDGTITLSLSEGAHRLEIEADDHKPYADTVMITSGKTETVAVELEEIAGPPPPPPPATGSGSPGWRKVMWASLAGGLAAGGVWIYGGAVRLPDINRKLCNGNANGCSNPEDLTPDLTNERRIELTHQGDRWEIITFTMGGVVAVAGTLTVIGAWKGYFSKSSGEQRQASSAGHRTRRELTVTPVISPNGGGATVRFDW
ncbi:MAG TPA: PEGA domain-containing protein [Kofleriaceae bacterium]|nr:PEGA domain-containing protein [Kofleriaceae bacterium]